jgi:chromosome segregation ATPase
MTEIPRRDTQLDRMEGKLDQLLERMTRMEERQNSHGATLESHGSRLEEHSRRIHALELNHAVSVVGNDQSIAQLNGRWAVIGAVSLVVLSTLGSLITRVIFP